MFKVESLTAHGLVEFLKTIPSEAGFIGRAKITYRPYICPFGDLLGLVKPGERVFDVGSGSGQFCLLLARYTHPSWVGGIEISEQLVKNAHQLFAHADLKVPHEFATYDGSTLPDSIQTADKVFLVDVLHHIPPLAQVPFLSALHASMKVGAQLIVKDIDGASPLVLCNKLHDLLLAGEIGCELPAPRLREMAHATGFRVVSESHRRMWWYPHFTLVLKK